MKINIFSLIIEWGDFELIIEEMNENFIFE